MMREVFEQAEKIVGNEKEKNDSRQRVANENFSNLIISQDQEKINNDKSRSYLEMAIEDYENKSITMGPGIKKALRFIDDVKEKYGVDFADYESLGEFYKAIYLSLALSEKKVEEVK